MNDNELDRDLARQLGKEDTHTPCDWSQQVSGRSVMVTGAGGFIGRDLADRVCSAKPSKIILIETSEYALYEAERLLRYKHPQIQIEAVLGSYGSPQVVDLVLSQCPYLVIHAGAYKHVPMVEKNAGQAVLNNVMEFRKLAIACEVIGCKMLVISSDKAVNPSSVMGATKKLVEEIALILGPKRTRVVRFGNVMWSSGSVLPLFKEQISRGQKITVTDFRADRYFMTLDQASTLVLQTLGLPSRGIYTLDMGQPVNIQRLVYALAGCMGVPYDQLDVQETGLRPGEKLHEELTLGACLAPTQHPQIMVAKEDMRGAAGLARALEELLGVVGKGNNKVREVLAFYVEGYTKSSDELEDCFSPMVPAMNMKLMTEEA